MSSIIVNAPKSDLARLYGYAYASAASAAERAAIREEAARLGISSGEVLARARSYSSSKSLSSSESSSYRVPVGMFRPDPLRSGGALSETEYFYTTGQKLGEDYSQTKTEVLSLANLQESDVKLTKAEEAKIIDSYLSARYQAAFGEQTLRQPQALRLMQDVLLGLEKGYLRSQFEKSNLAISENTLQEYISTKYERPDLTFPQFAYEKTIATKSDIERFGLGLFSQQALGFYGIGKMISPSLKNEYLDMLTIAQSYRPVVETEGLAGDIVRGYAPFQKNDLAYNIGVGVGVAIDVATLKAFGKGLISTIRSPKTVSAFLSEFRIGKNLEQYFRDVQISVKRMTPKEFIIKSFDPRSIPAQVKQTAKDAYHAITRQGTALDKEIRRITTASRATILEEKPLPLLAQNIKSGKVPAASVEPIKYIRTERGLSERSNVMFARQMEEQLSKDMTKAVEQVKSYIRDVREKPQFQQLYRPLRSVREPPRLSIPKIQIQIPKPTKPYRPSISLSESARMLNAEKEEMSRVMREEVRPPEPPTVETKPQMQAQHEVSRGVIAKTKTLEDEVMDAITKSRKEINDYIARTVKTRRRPTPTDIEYEIVRYPPRVNIRPPVPRVNIRMDTNVNSIMNNAVSQLNRSLEKELTKMKNVTDSIQKTKEDSGTNIDRVKDTIRLPTWQDIIITITKEDIRQSTRDMPMSTTTQLPMQAQRIKPVQIPKLKYGEIRLPYMTSMTSPFPPPPRMPRPTTKKMHVSTKKMQTEIFTYRLPKWVEKVLSR